MNDAIKAKGLVVKKDKQVILYGLDIVIKTGTITGLIGPSGSGKTTLMRSIVGVQKYQGELSVLGVPAGSSTLRHKIGYVTQTPAVYGDLTVRQNIEYFATIMQASASQVDKIIATVQLGEYAKQLVATLSGGQRARVSLAVALLGSPDLLILDEPTVGLDPLLRDRLWRLFQHLADSGKTLLVSSHVMDEADRCNNLLLMRDGKILWNDTRTELLKKSQAKSVGDAFVKIITETSHV